MHVEVFNFQALGLDDNGSNNAQESSSDAVSNDSCDDFSVNEPQSSPKQG